MSWWEWALIVVAAALIVIAIFDVVQRRQSVLRNYPVIGHLRFLLEGIGPELRQYIVTDNDADKPFTRDERRWVYTVTEQEEAYFGYGTDNDVEGSPNYLIVKHVAFPLPDPPAGSLGAGPDFALPCAKTLGEARGRARAFRMQSVVNISGMSYGSLSGVAVESLNRGAALAGCHQSTGEGGLTRHHRHGGQLVWQIGTGYFGCRDGDGRFDRARFLDVIASTPELRAVEIKLSQGAKPGIGGFLPGRKVSAEIAEIRGIPVGVDCLSPPAHTAFTDADGLLDFVEDAATATGLPIGIKSAVGHHDFFADIARLMSSGERGVDFVTIDGGEGGTGAAPLVFADHVALPFKLAFARVYREFVEAGVTDRVVFVGSGKLGLPQSALLAFALGCDSINVGREAMLAIGCIQAQRCHTDRCPTGVTTQSRWLTRGLDPDLKSVRLSHYVMHLRAELLRVARACGHTHPALFTLDDLEILDGHFHARPAREVFRYDADWGQPGPAEIAGLEQLMG